MIVENGTKADINLEIRELNASLRQITDPARRTEIKNQIKLLRGSRNALIANSHLHTITHERLVQAANTFEKFATARKDIDD